MRQLDRIRQKLNERSIELAPPLELAEVTSFERNHGVELPEGYRRFVLEVGSAGAGPPEYGLIRLGTACRDMNDQMTAEWTSLPNLAKAFPFTRHWIWEEGAETDEGSEQQVDFGSFVLGNDGCGRYWHLIVTGPDRGCPWMLAGEGIQPTAPKREFLDWYEDWLDGKDSFYGFDYGHDTGH